MVQRLSIILVISLTLAGCMGARNAEGTENLDQLYRLKAKNVQSDEGGMGAIRMRALEDTAMSLAAQSGLAARSKQINAFLERDETVLNQTFNFKDLMLEHNVLPPVLIEGRDSLNLANDNSIRLADRTYQILNQARFVTTPPTWREFLWMNYEKPPVPHTSLLPKNNDERKAWARYVDIGWKEGNAQADAIYAQNLARLKQEYSGMVLYRKLLNQNIVSPPFVAKTDLGITGDGSDIRIHDQVLRITAMPSLQTNSKQWKAAVVGAVQK